MVKVDTVRLLGTLALKKISIRNCAKELNIAYDTLDKKFKNPSFFRIGELEELCKLAGENFTDIVKE